MRDVARSWLCAAALTALIAGCGAQNGALDAGGETDPLDAGEQDAGANDAGSGDAGSLDAGVSDGGVVEDAGVDAGLRITSDGGMRVWADAGVWAPGRVCSREGWCYEYPSPFGIEPSIGMMAADGTHWISGGDTPYDAPRGLIAVLTDAGWSGLSGIDSVLSLWARSATDAWVIAYEANQPFVARWNGTDWQITEMPAGFAPAVVGGSPSGQVWLGAEEPGADTRLFRWDGAKWVSELSSTLQGLVAIHVRGNDDIWIGSANGSGQHWNGSTWTTAFPLEFISEGGGELWTGGTLRGIAHLVDGGLDPFLPGTGEVHALHVLADGTPVFASGSNGYAVELDAAVDGGKVKIAPTPPGIGALSGSTWDELRAYGRCGTIYRLRDGGLESEFDPPSAVTSIAIGRDGGSLATTASGRLLRRSNGRWGVDQSALSAARVAASGNGLFAYADLDGGLFVGDPGSWTRIGSVPDGQLRAAGPLSVWLTVAGGLVEVMLDGGVKTHAKPCVRDVTTDSSGVAYVADCVSVQRYDQTGWTTLLDGGAEGIAVTDDGGIAVSTTQFVRTFFNGAWTLLPPGGRIAAIEGPDDLWADQSVGKVSHWNGTAWSEERTGAGMLTSGGPMNGRAKLLLKGTPCGIISRSY